MNASLTNLTPRLLRRAADVQERIVALEKQLSRVLGPGGPVGANRAPKKRRVLSAAAHARISAAAKLRWAKIKARRRLARPAQKPKRKMTAAGRARLSARMRAYWAAKRAA